MGELLRWDDEPPVLDAAVLLVALDGFVDAGAVGATAAMFLRHRWLAERVATFDRDAFVDYRARRPTVVIDEGQLRRVDWPDLELLVARPEGPHDVAFLLGPEPDMRWEAFAREVVALARRLRIGTVVGLGAYPAAAPHTRPIRIARAHNGVDGGLRPEAIDVPGYSGPVGAATVLQSVLADAGIPAVGLWAEVPHYIAGSPNPSGALAVVQLLAALLGTPVDTTELEAAAKLHREQVDEAITEYPDAAEMVAALERHVDAGGGGEQLPSGDDIAAEIERFLRSGESD